MKGTLHIILLATLAVFISSCDSEDVSLESFDESNILGCWTHSYEEGDGVYRPCDFQTFPASRFRQHFDFKTNGECDYLVLASNDSHYTQTGLWTFNEETKEVRILDGNENVLLSFRIMEASEDHFVIEYTSQNSFIGG